MKRLARILAVLFIVAFGTVALVGSAEARSSSTHYTNQGGHYSAGQGSSHKGGTYKNARTGNHYTKH